MKYSLLSANSPAAAVACRYDGAMTGQNGSGQNGTDKMVWTKWYTDKMSLDIMVWTKWHEYKGADKIINQSTNPVPTDNMIFSSIPLPLGIPFTFPQCA